MCIIIAKKKGNRLPTKKELEYSFQHNPDGAGFMYTDNGKVVIDKGYMTFEKFYERYKALCKDFNNFKDKSLVIHCRIGTAGSNNAQNTHPYPLTNNIFKMHKLHTTTNVGIAHNGIISDYNPTKDDGDVNDTQNFIKTYLYYLSSFDKTFYKRKHHQDTIADITSSRFAILDSSDNLYLIGGFVLEDNLSFSNRNYKPQTYIYKSHSAYNSYYNNYWDNYYKKLEKDEI